MTEPLKRVGKSGVYWLLFAVVLCFGHPLGAQEKFEMGREGFEKVHEPTPGTPEGELQVVRRLIAQGKGKAARDAAKEWIKANPNHPLLVEAYLLRGDARVSYGRLYEALYDYEYVVRMYPESEQFNTAMEREMAIAEAFARGAKRHVLGMRIMPAAGEAEEIYIRIQERAPGSKLAERAGIELADYYYRRSEMGLAAEAYGLFLDNYPNSQWREHATRRQVLANLATFRGPRFDATGLVEAQSRLKDYKDDFPASAEQFGTDGLLTRIDESLATRTFLVGDWYEDRGKNVSAMVMYRRVAKEHPGTAAALRALERIEAIEPRVILPGMSDQLSSGEAQELPPPSTGDLEEAPPTPDLATPPSTTDLPDPARSTDAPDFPSRK